MVQSSLGSRQVVAQYMEYAGQGPRIFYQTVLTALDNLVLVLLGWCLRREQRISCARTKDLGTGDYTRAPRPPRGAQPPPCAFSRCSQVHTIGAPWGCAVHCDLCAGHNPSTAWYLGGQNIQTISRNSYPYPNPPSHYADNVGNSTLKNSLVVGLGPAATSWDTRDR